MTVPYAATPHSNRGYIRAALIKHEEEKGSDRRPTGDELTAFTSCILQAMKLVVPGPIKVMEWIKEKVRDYHIANPESDIRWMSPSGFPVIQDKRKLNIQRVKTQLLGDVIKSAVGNGFKEVDVNKHCSSSAPNFIHACDAALLHNSFAGFDQPFTLIHDSILTTAADMEYMSEVIRDEFVKMYEGMPLLRFAEVLGAESPDHLVLKTLDLQSCRKSTYFFC